MFPVEDKITERERKVNSAIKCKERAQTDVVRPLTLLVSVRADITPTLALNDAGINCVTPIKQKTTQSILVTR